MLPEVSVRSPIRITAGKTLRKADGTYDIGAESFNRIGCHRQLLSQSTADVRSNPAILRLTGHLRQHDIAEDFKGELLQWLHCAMAISDRDL